MNQPIALYCGKLSRNVGTALAVLLACATFLPFPLKAQQSPSQEVSTRTVEPTFKVQAERNLVTVRAVVRNKKGETVDNLRQEDFQVFDRGKKQTILQFTVDKATLNPGEQTASKPSQPEPGATGKSPPAFTLPRRFVALYFDNVSTGFSGLVRTRDAADRFLEASFHPGDRVGVFTASGEESLGFTDDLARVHQALAGLRFEPIIAPEEGCGVITPYEAYLITVVREEAVIGMVALEKMNCNNLRTPPSEEEIRLEAQRVQSESERRATVTLRGIESLVRLMTTLSGQRSIVIVSDGFMSQTLGDIVSQISDRALHANIIINALDARALFLASLVADASVAGRDIPARQGKEKLMREEALRQAEAMGTLAQDTGGIFFENNNDLEAGFRRVAAIPATSYTLAFSPENLKHDGAFHPIKVTLVAPKGVTVQARKGYYAPRKDEDVAAEEKNDLQDAVFSQNEMQAIPTQVNTQFVMIDKTEAEIDVVIHVDLNHVHFRKEGDRNLDDITFVTAIFDRDGRFISGQQKLLEMRLRDASMEKFLRTGIKVDTVLKAKPGTYLVRTVVRDSESGQISAVNSTVEIPN
jgi:VWFA-related protein